MNRAASPRPSGPERRKTRRYPCGLEAVCQPANAAPCSARIVDLSAAGIGLLLDRPLQPGDAVAVQLRTANGPRTLQMEVIHVAKAAPGCWLIGGAFLDGLDPAEIPDSLF